MVKGGQVFFIAANGQNVGAEIKEDGRYTAEKVPVGLAKITVDTRSLATRASIPQGARPPEVKSGGMSPEEAARRYVQVPERYADADTSGLEYMVKKGPQEHDVSLEGPVGIGGSGSKKPKGSSKGPPR
jgi:hypothetical protein